MGERKGTKGLELWCRRMTEGYSGVNVVNMTTSWRDGLAFCAIIHHFRPDLLDFTKLNKDDVYKNNELAFRIAEHHLNIPALLEPEDMVEFTVPDRLSILTYLSQFYQVFGVRQGNSPARIAPKRATSSPDHGIVSPASTSPPTKVAHPGKIRREHCAKCFLPVFIAERLNVGKLLYHRTCFRCARCNSQLTLANYYETENNQFCCELCPDEEKNVNSAILVRSLSDEEKSAKLNDDYSTKLEEVLEAAINRPIVKSFSSDNYKVRRNVFVNSQVNDSGNENEEATPDLPQTVPPLVVDSGFSNKLDDVNSSDRISVDCISNDEGQSQFVVTKDSDEGSLVRNRMQLFEVQTNSVKSNKVPLISKKANSFENKNKLISLASKQKMEEDVFIVQEELVKMQEPTEISSQFKVSSREEVPEIENIVLTDEPISFKEAKETESDFKLLPKTLETFDEVKDCKTIEEGSTLKEASTDEIIIESSCDEIKADESKFKEKLEEIVKEVNLPEKNVEKEKEEEEYPTDLNPFGEPEAPPNLNPFGNESDEETPPPKPVARKRIIPSSEERHFQNNPFEDTSEDTSQNDEPTTTRKKIIPIIVTNPFTSDDEENSETEVEAHPVPKPRLKATSSPVAKPRKSDLSLISSSTFGSSSSLSSTQSTQRKRKPAPKPPIVASAPNSSTNSPCPSTNQSPRSVPKFRKNRKAPLPPCSTPNTTDYRPFSINLTNDFDCLKLSKDESNRKAQLSPASSALSTPNKSTFGQWKRRKGQAPSRPIPQRRTIKALPIAEVKRELEMIEVQQQGLEKQGVKLEQIIRERCEGPNSEEDVGVETEEMILQLFDLVNEKNELFRKQTELMYLRRQSRLEEEHADVEYKIRCLMLQPEANKTDTDKAHEEELINRLVDIVERRNEIIECLEMDRVREAEEDDSITNQLNLYTAKKEDAPLVLSSLQCLSKKEKKKVKKDKKIGKIDADKDIDESESSTSSTTNKKKNKKKMKFAIF